MESRLQADGKLIVAGSSFNTASPDFLIVRYNGDGSLDNSFGNGGKVLTDFGMQDYAHAIAVQPDGKIVAAGVSQGLSRTNTVLARYNADGSLDSTFGIGGKVINGQSHGANALVLQADGKIVTAGVICGGGDCNFALIRFNTNGSLDSTLVKWLQRVKMFHRVFVNYLCSLALSRFFGPVFNQVSNLKFRERKNTLN